MGKYRRGMVEEAGLLSCKWKVMKIQIIHHLYKKEAAWREYERADIPISYSGGKTPSFTIK